MCNAIYIKKGDVNIELSLMDGQLNLINVLIKLGLNWWTCLNNKIKEIWSLEFEECMRNDKICRKKFDGRRTGVWKEVKSYNTSDFVLAKNQVR